MKALITGGATGIGLATAKEFARVGYKLVLVDTNKIALFTAKKAIQDEFGVETKVWCADVSSYHDAMDLRDKVGPVDVLINNAGIGFNGSVAKTPMPTWRKLVNVNLFGPLNYIDAFLPDMTRNKRGHIVNVSSGQAFFKLPDWGAYAAVKGALGIMTEVLAVELKEHNVGVTVVYPFMVNTSFHNCAKPSKKFFAKLQTRLLPYYADSPEKVAKLIFSAVQNKKTVEDVSIINTFGRYLNAVPSLYNIAATIAKKVLV